MQHTEQRTIMALYFLTYQLFTVYFKSDVAASKLINATECPLTQESWEEEADTYNCSGDLRYICILNELDNYVKGCQLPTSPIPPDQTNCPIFISATQTVAQSKYFTECNSTWEGCPPEKHGEYTIAELWKYPLCLLREIEREQGILTVSTVTVTTITTTIANRRTSPHSSGGSTAGIVIGVLLALLIILACAAWFMYKLRRSRKGFVEFCREIREKGLIQTLWHNKYEVTGNQREQEQEQLSLALPEAGSSRSKNYLPKSEVLQRHPSYPRDAYGQLLKPEDLIDLVIVYHHEAFEMVQREFIPWLRDQLLQREGLCDKDVVIELFDSEKFPPSDVSRVDDIVNKGTRVLVFLTANFPSDKSLEFFLESGIFKTRLQHNPFEGQLEKEIERIKKYCLRPVHTEPLDTRRKRYKTPTGLGAIHGIDFYDKDKKYAQLKAVDLVKDAVKDRKILATHMEEVLLGVDSLNDSTE